MLFVGKSSGLPDAACLFELTTNHPGFLPTLLRPFLPFPGSWPPLPLLFAEILSVGGLSEV